MAVEAIRARNDYQAEIAAGSGRLHIRFLGELIDEAPGLPFSPETNGHGDLAYAVSLAAGPKGALSLSDIYLNGERIAADRPVLDMAMNEAVLVWLETTEQGTLLRKYELTSGKIESEPLALYARRVVRSDDDFLIVGVDANSDDTVLANAGGGRATSLTSYGDGAIFLGGNADDTSLVRVTGDAKGLILYAALDRFLRLDTDEMSEISNEAGRLAWYQNYRLLAAASLAKATGDEALKADAVSSVMELLERANADGNFPASRYSLGDDPIAFSLHSALVYHSAFAAWEWMSGAQRASLVAQAVRSFNHFESDWQAYGYRFTPGIDMEFDGVVQPLNMQAAMGVFALDLYRATGASNYLDRVAAIFDRIAAELVVEDGTAVWHYWPRLFSDGWSAGTFDSVHRPVSPPSPPSQFEDVYHAELTITFLALAAQALNRPNVIDVEALFRSVQLGGEDFAATLDGAAGGFDYLPPWPDAASLWPLLARDRATRLGHYDDSVYDWVFAEAALRSGAGAATAIRAEILDPLTGGVAQVIDLTSAAEILAFARSRAFEPDAPVTGSIATGTAGSDLHDGSGLADAIRLLAGDDVASMGAGDDLAMGDFGDDRLFGGDGNDLLFGGYGADALFGGPGDDLLSGQAGDDILDGGAGADRLIGGGGDDFYIVDDPGDSIIEGTQGGSDYVATRITFTLTAAARAETLSAISHGATDPMDLTGNLFGQDVIGNNGANVLNGGGGADRLIGLGGNDFYIVDSSDDRVIEYASEGTDYVATRVSYALAGAAEVETLSTLSHAAIDTINLTGNAFGQDLIGNNGANSLDGGGGADRLIGLGGDDFYIVDSADDLVIEYGGDGRDYVASRVSFALAAGAEVETLSAVSHAAPDAIDLIGNGFGQDVIGNDGANVLNGGGGADRLIGLGGADSFAFTTTLGGANVDQIFDYALGVDRILLDDAVFAGLALGALAAGAFNTGSTAQDADDRILYDPGTGALYFDADGAGGVEAEQFASLSLGLAMTASEFTVI